MSDTKVEINYATKTTLWQLVILGHAVGAGLTAGALTAYNAWRLFGVLGELIFIAVTHDW